MNGNFINHELCQKCKLCIEVCPVNMIGIDADGLVNFIPERESICLECGQCMAVCTTDAVKIGKYTYENNFSLLPENHIDYKKFSDFIATRRSIRNFKKKPIEREIIEKILNVLKYAPYGAAPDKVEITVVNNRELIETSLPLAEKFLDDIVRWIENPVMSFIIKHKTGPETFSTIKNHLYPIAKLENYKLKFGDRITRGAPALIILHAKPDAEEHSNNALIYATYLMFAIHSLGLGGTMNGIMPPVINKVKEVKEIFKIPKENKAIISIMFGYPKYKYKKSVVRSGKKINWIN